MPACCACRPPLIARKTAAMTIRIEVDLFMSHSWLSHLAELSRIPATVNGAPDPLGGGRHLDMGNAEFRKSIDDRVDDDGQRRGGAALTRGANAERVGRCRYFAELGREEGQPVGARQRVIQQGGR